MRIRIGLGSCGIAAGGIKVMERLNQEISRGDVNIQVETTGCIGMCFYEPIVDVIEENKITTYGYVTEEIAEKIILSHIIGGQPVNEYIIYSNEKPAPFLNKQVNLRPSFL